MLPPLSETKAENREDLSVILRRGNMRDNEALRESRSCEMMCQPLDYSRAHGPNGDSAPQKRQRQERRDPLLFRRGAFHNAPCRVKCARGGHRARHRLSMSGGRAQRGPPHEGVGGTVLKSAGLAGIKLKKQGFRASSARPVHFSTAGPVLGSEAGRAGHSPKGPEAKHWGADGADLRLGDVGPRPWTSTPAPGVERMSV